MSDETKNTATEEVVFDEKQQAKVDELIRKAQGKAASELRRENETFKTQLSTVQSDLESAKAELARAKTPTDKKEAQGDISALQAQIDEMKRVHQNTQDEAKRWRDEAETRAKAITQKDNEITNIRKDVAITSAASKLPFVNVDVVKKLTESEIAWSDDYKQFVAVNDNGQVRLDATLEKPLSLDAFFNDFAAKNKYLVRGDVMSGTNATESMRSTLTKNGKYEVAQIFGPKSDARLANDLAKSDPQEYKRLKVVARQAGLVA
jgi:hypothetical protein